MAGRHSVIGTKANRGMGSCFPNTSKDEGEVGVELKGESEQGMGKPAEKCKTGQETKSRPQRGSKSMKA